MTVFMTAFKIHNYLKPFFDNVLLPHGGLPNVLPLSVHLDLEHLPNTQGYLGLLYEPCNPTQTLLKLSGGGVGWWPSRGGHSESLSLFEFSC